ncbi:ABC-2 type transport system ATP-binding protein [Sphingobacterium paludis]|uniref:ABC-2 type transport system ATP-binding protein n=2 Tax=Sphingobacterium paludis TaxID=1476465 RepID=A0A4V3E1M8_9SPHI|nr:ABC-2 type transport system ATP-binding protein [Sphingobacterium paludis]
MICIQDVSMTFPIPKKYIDYLFFRRSRYFQALTNVNLTIEDGDRVAFLGVNGAGKTTLLKLIGGLLYPSLGMIEVNRYDTVKDNINSRNSVGFVLNEERSFYWRLSGFENLEFFGILDNLHGDLLRDKIRELIRLVGLDGAENKQVATYSSGMKQRLALARGLLRDPKILILDEPTRTLDPKAVIEIKSLISSKIHSSTKRTLLIATHRFDEAEELCNKVCIMNKGQVLVCDTVESIKSKHSTIESFYHNVMNENNSSLCISR